MGTNETFIRNISIPWDPETSTYSKCEKYSFNQSLRLAENNSDVMGCDAGWVYDTTQYKTSVGMEVHSNFQNRALHVISAQ